MTRHPVQLSSLLLTAVLLLPGSGQAARVLVVARSVTPGAEKAAVLVEHFLTSLFDRDARHSAINVTALLGAAEYRRAHRALLAAHRLTERGRAAFDALELRVAVEHLNKALSAFERHAAELADMRPMANTLMMLGAAHLLLGEEGVGGRRISQAALIVPNIEPDPRMFSPRMREQIERISRAQQARAGGKLTVISNPPWAIVMLDGHLVGVTPLTVGGVASGRHVVAVARPGHQPYGDAAEVVSDGESRVTAALRPLRFFEDFDQLASRAAQRLVDGETEADVDPTIQLLGSGASAELVVVAAVRLDGDRIEVRCYPFDFGRQRALPKAKHVFGHDTRPQVYRAEMEALYREHFSGGETLQPARPEETGPGDKPTEGGPSSGSQGGGEDGGIFDSDDEHRWGYVVGGAGLAFMATGGILWALARRDNLDYRDAVQGSSRSRQLHQRGNRKAIFGDAAFVIGASATFVGAFLYFTW